MHQKWPFSLPYLNYFITSSYYKKYYKLSFLFSLSPLYYGNIIALFYKTLKLFIFIPLKCTSVRAGSPDKLVRADYGVSSKKATALQTSPLFDREEVSSFLHRLLKFLAISATALSVIGASPPLWSSRSVIISWPKFFAIWATAPPVIWASPPLWSSRSVIISWPLSQFPAAALTTPQ